MLHPWLPSFAPFGAGCFGGRRHWRASRQWRPGAKRLDETVTALGTVHVEATAAGIRALAESPRIRAVIEDQPIGPLPRPKR